MEPVSPNKDRLPQGCGGRVAMDGWFACLDLAIPASCPDGYVWLKTYMLPTFQQYSLPLKEPLIKLSTRC